MSNFQSVLGGEGGVLLHGHSLLTITILSGWWFQPTPLKNDGVKVSWDDYSIPNITNIWNIHNVPVTTNNSYFSTISH